jgi:hypothetical protein
MDEEIRRLADEIYREKIRAARMMTPEQKLLAGAQLFDYACRITLSGIRSQNPDASEERVQEILRERLALAERLEKARTLQHQNASRHKNDER